MENKKEMIVTSLSNYYGNLNLMKDVVDGVSKYYLVLDSHSSTNALEVDEDVWNSLIKFKDAKQFKLE